MHTRCITKFILGLALSCATAFTQSPTEIAIRKILADRFGPENRGIAIVVGLIDANGRKVVAYGSLAKNDKRRLDGTTVFEIGSMTKVFTSLLLTDMTRRGEVALADPVSKYLPAGVTVPERNHRKITLADLSTQSSGLPRMPTNFNPADESNPFADYSIQQLYDFLSDYDLTRDVGSRYEYSNVGVGLLGHALSLRAGMSYEALVRSRICDPLGMADTRITLTPEMKARLAVGHSPSLGAVSNWDLPTLPGAGALRSTANDILTFLAANLGYVKTPLAQAMADEVSIRRPADAPDVQIAYAWHVRTKNGNSMILHSGGTGGYRTFMGYDPKARAGVVVLTNVSTGGDRTTLANICSIRAIRSGRSIHLSSARRWPSIPISSIDTWGHTGSARMSSSPYLAPPNDFTRSFPGNQSSWCSQKLTGTFSSSCWTRSLPSRSIEAISRGWQPGSRSTRTGETGWQSAWARTKSSKP